MNEKKLPKNFIKVGNWAINVNRINRLRLEHSKLFIYMNDEPPEIEIEIQDTDIIRLQQLHNKIINKMEKKSEDKK
jgi:hypothetical protein